MLSPEIEEIAEAMEELGFKTGFMVGDGVGLTTSTLISLKNAGDDILASVGFPNIYKFTVTNVTDEEITIKANDKDVIMGFHPDSVHDNIFLIYRMGTDIPNAELYNIDNQDSIKENL